MLIIPNNSRYEAGYKDAMEHMEAEMKQKGSGTGF
jgi:hypothetical protein